MVDVFQAQVAAANAEAVAWGQQMETALRETQVDVLARVEASDGMGGSTPSYVVVATLQGRLQASQRDPQSVNIGGANTIRQLWEWVFATGTGVSNTARLRANGVTYAVIADDEPRSFSTAAHVLCYEVSD